VRSTHSDDRALSDDGVSVDAGARKDEIETGKINSDSGTVHQENIINGASAANNFQIIISFST
jgi:hypothetical protein